MFKIAISTGTGFFKGITFSELLGLGSVLALVVLISTALHNEHSYSKPKTRADDAYRIVSDYPEFSMQKYPV